MLTEMCSEHNAGIVSLTESHLHSDIRDAEISIPGYELYRCDRHGAKNGGVVTYVKSSFNMGTRQILTKSIGNVESMVLKMRNPDMLLIVMYRPPGVQLSVFASVMQEVKSIIELYENSRTSIVITGDLNMPCIDWKTESIHGGTRGLQEQAHILLEITSSFYLVQIIDQPTRGANLLDLCFVNNEELIYRTELIDTVISDHRLMILTTTCVQPRSCSTMQIQSGLRTLNFHSADVDWTQINQAFTEVSWAEIFYQKSESEIYDQMCSEIYRICCKYIPARLIKRSEIPRDRRVLMRKRRNLRAKLLRCNERLNPFILNCITDIENKIVNHIKMKLA